MKKKKCGIKRKFIILCIICVIYIVAVIMDVYTKGEIQWISFGKNVLQIVYILYAILFLLSVLWFRISKWWKNWNAIVWVAVITLAIPVMVHFWRFSHEPLTQDTLLSAYTEYLSFIGAFALGYFLYKREEIKNHEELKKKARILYESMEYIQINLHNLDVYIERGETYPIIENWKSIFLDIKHLIHYEVSALGSELQFFFDRIEAINKAIAAGDKERAKNLYFSFIEKEKHSPSAYNYMDAASAFLFVSLDLAQQESWKETEKDLIDRYAEEFFDVVNLRVYNYLLKKHLAYCEADLIEYELVEWLLQNPELNAWVKHPYEKRKITAVIFKIALAMNKKSPNLNYYWGQYSLK